MWISRSKLKVLLRNERDNGYSEGHENAYKIAKEWHDKQLQKNIKDAECRASISIVNLLVSSLEALKSSVYQQMGPVKGEQGSPVNGD